VEVFSNLQEKILNEGGSGGGGDFIFPSYTIGGGGSGVAFGSNSLKKYDMFLKNVKESEKTKAKIGLNEVDDVMKNFKTMNDYNKVSKK